MQLYISVPCQIFQYTSVIISTVFTQSNTLINFLLNSALFGIFVLHTSPKDQWQMNMIYWCWHLCCLKACLVLKHIRRCWRGVLMKRTFMSWKWISRPKSLLALVAGNGDSLQMICLNVIFHIGSFCLFSTQWAKDDKDISS